MSTNRLKLKGNNFLQKKRSIKSKEQVIKPKIGPWDEAEDKKLKDWVKKNGAYNWTVCAEYMQNRTAKQCREHWKNTIDDNLIKGQWTAEEDLLIMKFYEKYESWRKMIPMFKNRTENSIKNRFFSQLRKIVVKQRPPNGKKEYGTKYGLDTLKKFLNEGIKQAEKRYYEENKNMTKEDFENYMIQIENLIKNRKKGIKFIDMKSLKRKSLSRRNSKNNIINIKEDEDDDNNEQLYDEEKEENLETFNNINKKREHKKEKKNNIFKTEKNIEEDCVTREETTNLKDNKFNFGKKKSKSKIITNFQKKPTKELDIIQENNEPTLERKNSKKDIDHNEITFERKKSKKNIEHNEITFERKKSRKDIEHNEITFERKNSKKDIGYNQPTFERKNSKKDIEHNQPTFERKKSKKDIDYNEITFERKNSKKDIEHTNNNEENKRITRQIERRNSRTNINNNNCRVDNFLSPCNYDFRIDSMPNKQDEFSRSESIILNDNEEIFKEKQKYEKCNKYPIKPITSKKIKDITLKISYMPMLSLGQSGEI